MGKTTKDVLFYNGLTNLKDVNSKKNIPVSVDLLESLSSEALIFEIENDIELSLSQKIHNNPTIEKIIENKLLDIDFGSEEINETKSSRYLIQEASGVPLLKGNNITAFLKPICSKYVQKQHFCENAKNNFYNFPRLIWGNVRNLNMSKRMCFTLCPPNYAIGNSLNYIVHKKGDLYQLQYLCAVLNSFVIEYQFRKVSSNNNVNKKLVKNLPVNIEVVNSPVYTEINSIFSDIQNCTVDSFEYDVAIAKINALVSHIYAVSEHELKYILDKFNSLKRMEEKKYGTYRTKDLILDYYDRYLGLVESANKEVKPAILGYSEGHKGLVKSVNGEMKIA